MDTAVSAALSILSSVQREMENSECHILFIRGSKCKEQEPIELQDIKEIDQYENRKEKDTCKA